MDVLCVGHAAYDVTMAVASHPGANEKIQAQSMQMGGGGPAANAAVCISRLKGKASFCGYLGNDLFGQAYMDELMTEGVETSLVVRNKYPTPVSQVLAKPDGTRSVVNFRDETPCLPCDAVDFSSIQAKIVLFDGHEPLLSGKTMVWAKSKCIPTVLDAGSLHSGTDALALEADYLTASAEFARQFCHTDNMQNALKKLSAKRNCVVITMGEAGLIWFRNGETGGLPAFAVQVVDSTGAGDAFHGAFALAIARNMNWLDALRFASKAGALTCTKLGARHGLPYKDNMEFNSIRTLPD